MIAIILQTIIWITLILIIIAAAGAVIHARNWQAKQRATSERLTMSARAARLGKAARTTGITVIVQRIADRPKASDQGREGVDAAHPR